MKEFENEIDYKEDIFTDLDENNLEESYSDCESEYEYKFIGTEDENRKDLNEFEKKLDDEPEDGLDEITDEKDDMLGGSNEDFEQIIGDLGDTLCEGLDVLGETVCQGFEVLGDVLLEGLETFKDILEG